MTLILHSHRRTQRPPTACHSLLSLSYVGLSTLHAQHGPIHRRKAMDTLTVNMCDLQVQLTRIVKVARKVPVLMTSQQSGMIWAFRHGKTAKVAQSHFHLHLPHHHRHGKTLVFTGTAILFPTDMGIHGVDFLQNLHRLSMGKVIFRGFEVGLIRGSTGAISLFLAKRRKARE